MKVDLPLSINLIFVEWLILSNSVSFIEDQQSGILCQFMYTTQLLFPYLFLKKSEKYSHW